MKNYTNCIIEWDNDTWRVIGSGAIKPNSHECNDDSIHLHLASTTRFREQRNGRNPLQINDWVPLKVLLRAATN